MATSVYIHIPFCKKICSYCDFCKFIYNEKWVGAYLTALRNEIKDRYMDEEINTLYIGGGTPSSLSISELKRLFNILKLFHYSPNIEFTFECNIEDINSDLLTILKEGGVNRLSIGIESFNKNNLAFMERNADFKDAKMKMKLCRDLGFNNINLDLMYALPNEKMADLKKDLNYILKLNPEHISTYSLILEPHTKAYINETSYASEELDYKMYLYICKTLDNANHYELSNFAIPGYESKHNLVYWNNEEYYGFGLGASGYIDGIRYTNTRSFKKYLLGDVVKEKELVNKTEQMKYEVILGLRKLKGINKKDFQKKYNISIHEAFDLKKLIKNKDLIEKKEYIYINPDKLYVMNEILARII